jgi:hypothetical protein
MCWNVSKYPGTVPDLALLPFVGEEDQLDYFQLLIATSGLESAVVI